MNNKLMKKWSIDRLKEKTYQSTVTLMYVTLEFIWIFFFCKYKSMVSESPLSMLVRRLVPYEWIWWFDLQYVPIYSTHIYSNSNILIYQFHMWKDQSLLESCQRIRVKLISFQLKTDSIYFMKKGWCGAEFCVLLLFLLHMIIAMTLFWYRSHDQWIYIFK